jgi:predicted aconitase with swiveling domain
MSEGRTLVRGEARGPALVLSEPLSFWGGLDPATGAIIDVHHPQRGAVVTGTVLVMPGGRGSSSSPSVLAEAIRARTAPAAIVLTEPDPLIALGAIVARELYGASIPITEFDTSDLLTGREISVSAGEDGTQLQAH